MKIVPEGWRRAFRIWRRPPLHDVDAELQFHLEERAGDLIALGVDADTARTQALREFGDVDSVRRGLVTIDERIARRRSIAERLEWLGQDLRYVWRVLQRSPGFVAMVALTLALGLGANAAVFSLIDRLFLQAPPGIAHPDQVRRLYRFHHASIDGDRPGVADEDRGDFSVFSNTELRDLKAALPPATPLGGYRVERLALGDRNQPIPAVGAFVLGDYFALLGVRPALGRFFEGEQRLDVPDAEVVISQHFWRQTFQSRLDVVGQSIEIQRHRYTVVGVVAGPFHGADNDAVDLWLPFSERRGVAGNGADWEKDTFWANLLTVARSRAAAAAIELDATAVLRTDDPSHDSSAVARLAPLVEAAEPGDDGHQVALATRLAGVSLIILLISWANVANLIFARGLHRRREIAVRLALGIGRRRLIGLLLAESITVAGIGGIVALAAAYPGALLLRRAIMPEVHWTDSPLDLHLLLLMLALTIATGIASGLLPALHASRPDLTGALKNGVGTGTFRSSKIRTMLLITQTALSVLLVAGAGLFVRSLQRIAAEKIGYDVDQVIYASLAPDDEHPDRRTEISRRLPVLARQLALIPGVERVGLTTNMSMQASWAASVYLPNRDSLVTSVSFVSPDYLAAVGVPVLQGRGLRAGDGAGTAVLVNRAMAQRLWPGQSGLGQCLIQHDVGQPCSIVVGIVADAHEMRIDEAPIMRFYAPLADTGSHAPHVIALRTGVGMAIPVAARIRQRLDSEFGGWATSSVRLMSDSRARELQPWRIGAALFSAAGLLALLVAVVGVYSTVSYVFGQRTREIGIRMALGAQAGNVAKLVVGEGVGVVLIGVTIGIVLALAAGRIVESMLYHMSARDPVVLMATAGTILMMAVMASLVPAWRAIRVDPATALRAE